MWTSQKKHDDEGHVVIIVAKIRLRSGRVLYARDYGLKGFPIRVKRRR